MAARAWTRRTAKPHDTNGAASVSAIDPSVFPASLCGVTGACTLRRRRRHGDGVTEPLRTGCLLRTETRLKALMLIATQTTAEISSSDRTLRASA